MRCARAEGGAGWIRSSRVSYGIAAILINLVPPGNLASETKPEQTAEALIHPQRLHRIHPRRPSRRQQRGHQGENQHKD